MSDDQLRELLPTLLEEQKSSLLDLRENVFEHGSRRDRHGDSTGSLSRCLRHLAALEYLVNGDILKFRSHTTEATELLLGLFERFEAGEPIGKHYLTWARSEEIMGQLATGHFEPARRLVARIGVLPALAEQSVYVESVERGPALKAMLLGDDENVQRLVDRFETDCGLRENRYQLGYARLLQAILAQDLKAANVAMKLIVKRHVAACTPRGRFGDGWPRFLSVWGVGLANLAISRGLPVTPIPPQIPEDLLVGDLDAAGRD